MKTAEELLANNIDGLREVINDDDLFFFYKGVVCEFAKEFGRLSAIDELEKHVVHPKKPGYRRHDILNKIKELKEKENE